MSTALDNLQLQVNPVVTFGLFSDDVIYIELSSDSDPHGKCIANMEINWRPYFCFGEVAPQISAAGHDLQLLATYPQILDAFKGMQHGNISMEAVLKALSPLGKRHDLVKPTMTASKRCDEQTRMWLKDNTVPAPYEVPLCGNLFIRRDFNFDFLFDCASGNDEEYAVKGPSGSTSRTIALNCLSSKELQALTWHVQALENQDESELISRLSRIETHLSGERAIRRCIKDELLNPDLEVGHLLTQAKDAGRLLAELENDGKSNIEVQFIASLKQRMHEGESPSFLEGYVIGLCETYHEVINGLLDKDQETRP